MLRTIPFAAKGAGGAARRVDQWSSRTGTSALRFWGGVTWVRAGNLRSS